MRPILYLLLALCLLSCNRKMQLQSSVIPLDSLSALPYDSTLQLAEGITIRRLSPFQALLIQPVQKQGKTKYKNVGNTDVKQKDVGNVDVGKKAGQHQDVGNMKLKDVGQHQDLEQKSQSYWWLWLFLGIILYMVLRKIFLYFDCPIE